MIELTEHVARTNSQNAYLHVLLRVLAMEFGETVDYVKENTTRHWSTPRSMREEDRPLPSETDVAPSRDLTRRR